MTNGANVVVWHNPKCERPVAIRGSRATIGRPTEKIEALLRDEA